MTIIKKCKDCKYFMADCNFSKVDKELQAMEDFIACKHFKSKNETNADKIRNMSDKELAKFIQKIKTTCFVDFIGYANKDCEQGKISCKDCQTKAPTILEWLQAEADRR